MFFEVFKNLCNFCTRVLFFFISKIIIFKQLLGSIIFHELLAISMKKNILRNLFQFHMSVCWPAYLRSCLRKMHLQSSSAAPSEVPLEFKGHAVINTVYSTQVSSEFLFPLFHLKKNTCQHCFSLFNKKNLLRTTFFLF